VHDRRPGAGEFEHFVVADHVDLAGFRDEPRVGGVYPVDVGVNLAADREVDRRRARPVVLEHRGQGNGRRVRPAATEGGDVEVFVDPLKSGDDYNHALGERPANAVGRNVLDAGLGMRRIGDDTDLGTGE
jgi:hypothetical protein